MTTTISCDHLLRTELCLTLSQRKEGRKVLMTSTLKFRNLTSPKESKSLSLYRLQKRSGKKTVKLQEAKTFWLLEAFRFLKMVKFIHPFNVFTHFPIVPTLHFISFIKNLDYWMIIQIMRLKKITLKYTSVSVFVCWQLWVKIPIMFL